MSLPLIGATVPERNLTPEERARMEELIRAMYTGFVEKVAEGRDMTPEEVDAVGQGRVWSGTRGREKGLVDELGGLWLSLRIAREAAKLPPQRPIELTEGPGLGPFRLELPMAKLFGLGAKTEPVPDLSGVPPAAYPFLGLKADERRFLECFLQARGRPILLMEPCCLSDGSRDW